MCDSWGIIKGKNMSEIYKKGIIEYDGFVGKSLQSFSRYGTFPLSMWEKVYRGLYYLKCGRTDCIEKTNIKLIDYFCTYVNACALRDEKRFI